MSAKESPVFLELNRRIKTRESGKILITWLSVSSAFNDDDDDDDGNNNTETDVEGNAFLNYFEHCKGL